MAWRPATSRRWRRPPSPPAGDRQRSHGRRAQAAAGRTGAAAAGLRLSKPAPRTRRRSTTPTWPPPWRSPSRAARPTPASSSTARGSGSAIAANKVRGIRAAMCVTPTLARYAREHNGANVLALGATLADTGRGAGHRRDLPGHADDGGALHRAAGQGEAARTTLTWWSSNGSSRSSSTKWPRRRGRCGSPRSAGATPCCTSAAPTGCGACSTQARPGSGCTPPAARPATSRRSSITRCSSRMQPGPTSRSSVARPPSTGSPPSA